jgi:hypothetical protein
MKRIDLHLLALLFVVQSAFLFGQSSEKITPWFTLSIEEKQLPTNYSSGEHQLVVKYTNVSQRVQQDNCAISPWVYKTLVLHNGIVATKRKTQSNVTEASPDLGGKKVHPVKSVDIKVCGKMSRGFDPNESKEFPIWVSSEYDMTLPGTYDITVTRETEPDDPARSVTVKSNTITITVVAPEPAVAKPE